MKLRIIFGIVVASLLLSGVTPVHAALNQLDLCKADINSDSIIDISDYSILALDFLRTPPNNPRTDLTGDNLVDIADFSFLASGFLQSATGCTTAAPSASPALPSTGEWTQFAHNAQRTSYTYQTVNTPWKYKWQWNGAGADGKKQAGHLAVPDLVQPITGGGRIYMVAANTVYALNKSTGAVIWSKGSIGTLSSTPAYDQENIYVASGNNILYKLNAATGAQIATYTAPSALNLAPLLANNRLYVVSASGVLYALDPVSMTKVWEYNAGSPAATVASYSTSKNVLLLVSQDLFVHAVNANDGTRKWRVKPTVRTYTTANAESNLTEALEGWPVIAEQHGIVFVRYRLEWQTLFNGPALRGTFPNTNAEARSFLTSNPKEQALFAMKIDDGSTAFIPNAGNGGAGDGGYLPMGPQPVIRVVNGQEVAYMLFRNGQVCASESWCDFREETTMGEMVLDNTTIPGYVAGDMRFVAWRNLSNTFATYHDMQTDEMMYITGSGSTLYHNHWLVSDGYTITDRGNALGGTYANPIKTVTSPNIIWRQVYCAPNNNNCNPQIFPGGSGTSWGPSNCPFNALSRYCSAGLYGYGDQRSYAAGFYEYHNDNNSGSIPFVIVSGDQVIVKTNDGALIVLENGNPTADSNQPTIATLEGTSVLGSKSETIEVDPTDVKNHLNKQVVVKGKIHSVTNHRPKAMYLSFTENHSDSALVRVFEKDLAKFGYDLSSLEGKEVEVTGFVTLYWPEGKDAEIVVTEPSQIKLAHQ